MANLDQPAGFRVFGEARRVTNYIADDPCYPGDLVKKTSAGKVTPAAAGDAILGLCLGYASADGVSVAVADHPDQLIVGQADETEVDAQTDVFQQCDHLATAGDATYKTSRQEVDSSTIGAGPAGLEILAILGAPDNALGTNVKLVCKINEHQLAHGVGLSGV